MITAERLEELIKQGATIWSSGYDEEIKLNPKNCRIEKQKWRTEPKPKLYLVVKEDEEHYPTYCLDNLREDVDRAKWERDMTAERTERFEPPMWEDIEVIYTFKFINDNECMSLIANKKYNFVAISNSLTVLFEEKYTKENYIKACEIVRDLFNKGGAK